MSGEQDRQKPPIEVGIPAYDEPPIKRPSHRPMEVSLQPAREPARHTISMLFSGDAALGKPLSLTPVAEESSSTT